MTACGVHDPANPKFLMPITRRLFGRSGLTQTEIDLLRGICAAIIRPKARAQGLEDGCLRGSVLRAPSLSATIESSARAASPQRHIHASVRT